MKILRLIVFLFTGKMYLGKWFVSAKKAYLPNVGIISREKFSGLIQYSGTFVDGGGWDFVYNPADENGIKFLKRTMERNTDKIEVQSDHEVAYLFAEGIINWKNLMFASLLPNGQIEFTNFIGSTSLII